MFHLRLGCAFFALTLVCTGFGADIINGKEVTPHSLPYMALLFTEDRSMCGGTLISPEWVLTAAHCYNDCDRIDRVILGVHNIKKKKGEKKSRQVRKPRSIIIHPCYNSEREVHDLMLIKLNKPVMETETVKVLPLRNKVEDPAAGSSCLVAGWGDTKFESKKAPDVLRSVNVTVIGRDKCNSKDYYNLIPPITRAHICAGSDGTNIADSCQGDSGGPIICNGNLVGVTSFGDGCGIIKKPGVYAFLSKKQLEWIDETMTNEI